MSIDVDDFQRGLSELARENLIVIDGERVRLTPQGEDMSQKWQHFLQPQEFVLETIAGLTDGSITGLVVILSTLIGSLGSEIALFAAFLTLAAVAITNFSSFFLGGITEDLTDLITLQSLLQFSLGDNPDKGERDKSLILLKNLFQVYRDELRTANAFSAIICSVTTFLAGSIPIILYLFLPQPLDVLLSLAFVGLIIGVFLVRYRASQSRVHWKVTLLETIVIIVIAVVVSLLLGQTA